MKRDYYEVWVWTKETGDGEIKHIESWQNNITQIAIKTILMQKKIRKASKHMPYYLIQIKNQNMTSLVIKD